MNDPVVPFKSDARFAGVPIVVGVTGGIAAYKVCTVVSALAQAGAAVTVCMSESAQQFVTPATFRALSGRPVITSMWDHEVHDDPQHIALARGARAILVAPATMNTLARIANGFADDPVSLVLSAADPRVTPVLLAPSMNAQMWAQASTQRNLSTLRSDGFRMIEPGDGWQACRTKGTGRMAEPARILHDLAEAVSPGTSA